MFVRTHILPRKKTKRTRRQKIAAYENSKGTWFASLTDQKGERRFISLKTREHKVAEQIADQIVPHELARTRQRIHKEVVRYLEDKAEPRSPNWTRDGRHVFAGLVLGHFWKSISGTSNNPFSGKPTPAMAKRS